MSPRRVTRRKFLTYLGIAGGGLAIGGAAYLGSASNPAGTNSNIGPASQNITQRKPLTIAQPKNPYNYIPDEYIDFIKWLQSVSNKLAGKEIRIALEAEVGPRALFRNKIDFETATGINTLMEFEVYQANLAKTLLAVTTRSPTYDIINIDISQVGRFKEHLIPIEELINRYPELTYPKLNLDDFERAIWNTTCKYPPDLDFAPYNKKIAGTQVQMPQETPLMIRYFRRDLYQQEKRSPALTWDEYYDDVKHFHKPEKAQFGTVLMGARFTSVIMEWHNHLYSFGGKLWDISEEAITSSINSDEAIASLENYARLFEYAEPASASYGWLPVADSIRVGRSVTAINFTEFAAGMDILGESNVIGKIGFDKNPKGPAGQSHHYSGAGLSVPKYSKNPEAAWLWIQWATIAGMQVIVALDIDALSVPTRKSVFSHPEVQRVSGGGLRHIRVARDVLDGGLINFKPGFPNWHVAEGVLMENLNQAVSGKISPRQALKEAKDYIDTQGKFSF
ncbi:MAG: extracellular solute-binding protein [Thaumarchaeota archaeon]|nr:extracellular solute-binding protein [Nitrososphaerota archaeon]